MPGRRKCRPSDPRLPAALYLLRIGLYTQ